MIDVDSTLSGIEGIDWLAARRGPECAVECQRLTAEAMDGSIPIESVFGLRLELVRPGRADLEALAAAYLEAALPGTPAAIAAILTAGTEIRFVSGGLRPAIAPFIREFLGRPADEVHAVDVFFDAGGGYAGWEQGSPLATTAGKPIVVRSLELPGPVLAVGDGATDLAIKGTGATFAAYTGFVRREGVVAQADLEVQDFDDVLRLVRG